MFTPGRGAGTGRGSQGPPYPCASQPPPTSLEGSFNHGGPGHPTPTPGHSGESTECFPSRREGPARARGYGTSELGGMSAPTRAGGSQPHLWVQTAWRSRACGRRAFHRARQRAGVEGGVWPGSPPPPCLGAGLTSAWPPGVSVLLQCSHRRQNLCQSLPRELTFSAGREGSVSAAPPLPMLSPCCPPGPGRPRHLGPLHHPPGVVWPPPPSTSHHPGSLLGPGNLDGLPAQTCPSLAHAPLTWPQTLQEGPVGASRVPVPG